MNRIYTILAVVMFLLDFAHSQCNSTVNVKCYGAVGDGRAVTHAVTTASNTTVADTTDSPWTSADVGKTIVLYSSTFAGQVTTIQTFTDSAHIVLAAAPISSTTVIAVWGTDDTAAIQRAVASIPAMSPVGLNDTLYFPAGIYLIHSPIAFTNAIGLHVLGDGPGSDSSLGTYNASGPPGGGTSLVWVGSAGGVIGCTGNTGSPPTGINNATTNCNAAENYMVKLSGQFILENINLQGSRLVSHLLEIGGGDVSSSIGFSVRNVSGGYGTQYGFIIGGTNADQPSNFGEAYLENIELAYDGLVNSALNENDPTCGGDVWVRYGAGNFQKKWNTGYLGSSSDVDGCHHIYWYSGNYSLLTNLYFAPLTGNSTSHSSIYFAASTAGMLHTFDNLYDENGYFLHVAGGNYFDLRQIQTRKQTTTNPHFAMVFDSNVRVTMNGVHTAGLPIVFNAGGTLNHHAVTIGSLGLGASALYKVDNCSTGGCITRSGSTVTMTTATPHGYATGDWIQVNAVADATYNGVFQITNTGSTTYTYVDAAAVGASTQGGTSAIGCCIIASTATNLTPQATSPFLDYNSLWNGYGGSNADIFSAIVTNLAAKNSLVFIPAALPGANGSSLPAAIPAGWNFFDLRGGTPTFYGGPYRWGSTGNPVQVGFNGSIADGSAFKHGRVSTGSCAATGCSVTLNWATAFADANYTVSCGLEDATAQSETTGLRLGHITSKIAASVTMTLDNLSGAGVTGTLDCIATHD